METRTPLPPFRGPSHHSPGLLEPRFRRARQATQPLYFNAQDDTESTAQRQAELFYLQKQIQSQTPMVVVLEDGEQIEGIIEWYDRHSLKVRGRVKCLVYKSAIKYMYKLGDAGQI